MRDSPMAFSISRAVVFVVEIPEGSFSCRGLEGLEDDLVGLEFHIAKM
jgi:hypothetical protein